MILSKLSDWEFELVVVGGYKRPVFGAAYLKSKNVVFGNKIRIGKEIYIKNGYNLILGERCSIGSFTKIWDYNKITIGEDFLSAGILTINNGTHDLQSLTPSSVEIKIGDRVWCGMNVTILAGANIGSDVIIGAGSIVINDIPDNSVAVGMPAKVIKVIDRTGINIFNQHNW